MKNSLINQYIWWYRSSLIVENHERNSFLLNQNQVMHSKNLTTKKGRIFLINCYKIYGKDYYIKICALDDIIIILR